VVTHEGRTEIVQSFDRLLALSLLVLNIICFLGDFSR